MIHVRRTAVRCCPVSLHRVAAAAALLGAQLGASAQQSTAPDANALPEAGKLPTVASYPCCQRWATQQLPLQAYDGRLAAKRRAEDGGYHLGSAQ